MKKFLILIALSLVAPSALANTLGENVGTCRGFISFVSYSPLQKNKMIAKIALKEWEAFFYLNENKFSYEQPIASMESYLKAGVAVKESMELYNQMNPEKEHLPYPPMGRYLRAGLNACTTIGVTSFPWEGKSDN